MPTYTVMISGKKPQIINAKDTSELRKKIIPKLSRHDICVVRNGNRHVGRMYRHFELYNTVYWESGNYDMGDSFALVDPKTGKIKGWL